MMKELLESKGWVMYYECHTCTGHRQYFNHKEKPGYEIRVRTKKKTFSILLKNLVIAGPFYGYMLDQKLTQYVQ